MATQQTLRVKQTLPGNPVTGELATPANEPWSESAPPNYEDLWDWASSHGGIIGDDRSQFFYGTDGSDVISARGGDDTIFGNNGHDRLDGEDGNDHIYGGFGNDTLWGGAGDDHLTGNLGDDIYYGGAGNDTFHITADLIGFQSETYDSARLYAEFYKAAFTDTVKDFNAAEDLISIEHRPDNVTWGDYSGTQFNYTEFVAADGATLEDMQLSAVMAMSKLRYPPVHVFVTDGNDGYLFTDLAIGGPAPSIALLTTKLEGLNSLDDFDWSLII